MSKPRPPPQAARDAAMSVAGRLRDQGHEALFAGGCVRDLLMGHPPTDFDVATSATPEQVLATFRRTRAVGRQFGVVLVSVRGVWIEVATFRSDAAYSDGRHPDSVRFSSAREDAQRRDFTINGMFLDPLDDRVIDYVGGQADLQAGVIRAIGDPACRFAEDHLRLLRAVRFAARFGFQIEPVTWRAVRDAAHLLPRVSAERVSDELERMLTAPTRACAWELLAGAGLVPRLWDGAADAADRAAPIGRLLAALPGETISLALVMAVLTLPDEHATQRACISLRLSNSTRDAAVWLVRHHRDLDDPARATLAAFKRVLSDPAAGDLLALIQARAQAGDLSTSAAADIAQRAAAIEPAEVAPPPLLTGDDLIRMGIPQGPAYRRILDAVYDAQLNGEIRDRAEAADLARRVLAELGGRS